MTETTHEEIQFEVVKPPVYKSKLIIYHESVFVVQTEEEMPCWWHRLWLKLLLGWTWEKI